MNEAETRRTLIDEKLKLAGWNVKDKTQVIEELDIHIASITSAPQVAEPKSPYAGHQFADYALLLNGKPVAVVEVKRGSKDAELGKEQALQDATNLQELHGGELPLILYTNGYDIHFWESDFYPPYKVHGFPTRADVAKGRTDIADRVWNALGSCCRPHFGGVPGREVGPECWQAVTHVCGA